MIAVLYIITLMNTLKTVKALVSFPSEGEIYHLTEEEVNRLTLEFHFKGI